MYYWGIKSNERTYQAAIRELKEETGLYPEKMWTVDCVNSYYDPKYDSVFLIPVFGIEVKSKDVNYRVNILIFTGVA